MLSAPWLMRALAPGLDPKYFDTAVNILRILALSTVSCGVAAVHCAMLYTDRRFGPAAFYQAAINIFTIVSALCLWKFVGVYAFAIGYTDRGHRATGHGLFRRALRTEDGQSPGVQGAVAGDSHEAGLLRGLRRRPRVEYHLHARLRHPRRTRHGGGARLLHARRRRAAGPAGQPDLQLPAARNRAPAQPAAPARGAPPDR